MSDEKAENFSLLSAEISSENKRIVGGKYFYKTNSFVSLSSEKNTTYTKSFGEIQLFSS